MDKKRLKELVHEVFDTYETEGNFDFLDYPQKALKVFQTFNVESYRNNEKIIREQIKSIFLQLKENNGDIQAVMEFLGE